MMTFSPREFLTWIRIINFPSLPFEPVTHEAAIAVMWLARDEDLAFVAGKWLLEDDWVWFRINAKIYFRTMEDLLMFKMEHF